MAFAVTKGYSSAIGWWSVKFEKIVNLDDLD